MDPAALGRGLRVAVHNFMHGVGLDRDVREWFEAPVPAPTLAADAVATMLSRP